MKNCKKLIKKLLCFAILSALVITMSQPVFSYAEDDPEEKQNSESMQEQKSTQYDITKPVINKVEFLQQGKTLKEGDTIQLKVYAFDLDSEIKSVDVNARYEGGYSVPMKVSYNEIENCYICECELKKISGSKLIIDSVTATDQTGNVITQSMYKNGEYTMWANVKWQQPEETEVHVKNLQFKQNGQTINETELLDISLEVDKAFEKGTILVSFQNVNGGTLTAFLPKGESDLVFQNDRFSINPDTEDGKWILSEISIMSFPECPVSLFTDEISMRDYSFTLEKTPGTEETRKAPVITQIDLDKNGETLCAGDYAIITVYATDDQGMMENGNINFRAVSDIMDSQKNVDITYNEVKGAYEGRILITDEMYPCEWYIESIDIYNTLGNRADDSVYISGTDYPYYILVKNGSTQVIETYDLYVNFYVLGENGIWKEIHTVRKDIERHQTMKEAGIVFPKINAEYPGFVQNGWVDSEGNEITEDSQCPFASGSMAIYAKYDKKLINVSYQSLTLEGRMYSDNRKMVIPSEATFGDLKKEIESAAAPEETYCEMQFQGWSMDLTSDYQEDAILPDIADFYFSANAVYDKNVLTIFRKYPVSNTEWRNMRDVVVYERGVTYGELIKNAIDHCPDISLDGYELKKWEYKINGLDQGWSEEHITDISDNYMQIQCTAQFSGYTMILIRQSYISKEGNRNFYYPFYMVKDGTKWEEICKNISVLKVPEICENRKFDKWSLWPELGNSATVKNGFEISMEAQYLQNPENVPTDKPTENDPDNQPPGETQPGKQQGIHLSEKRIIEAVEIITETKPGIPIQIDMAGATVIPKEILEAAKGKNNEIVLNMGGYSWTVNGTDIAATDLKSIDLKVTMDTDNIPGKTIRALAGDHPVQQLSLVHQGDFGFKAILTVNVGNEHAGKFGNLYYHDSDGKLVFIDAGEIAPGGNVSLTFSHASDYMIVMSDQKMSQANVPDELAPVRKPGGTQPGGDQNQPGDGGQPGSGNQNPSGNGSQGRPGTDTENPSGNPAANEQDAAKSQTETTGQTQAASNSQSGAQNKSVQTGDETEAVPLVLVSILSLGILICMWKKQKTC